MTEMSYGVQEMEAAQRASATELTGSSTGTMSSMGHCVNQPLVTCFCSARYIRDPASNVSHILSHKHNRNSKVIQVFKT